MNYYKRHLGDYAKKAGHLSPLEHGVYTLILDGYHREERAPTLEDAMAWTRAKTAAEREAVLIVLGEFFELLGGRYLDAGAEAAIAAWRARGWFPSAPDVIRARPPIDEWKETRLRIFARDNYTCTYCGAVGGDLECDHVVPVSLGGSSTDDNLATACKTCNRAKSNKPLSTWLTEIGGVQ